MVADFSSTHLRKDLFCCIKEMKLFQAATTEVVRVIGHNVAGDRLANI
jgi:hypothetical protein